MKKEILKILEENYTYSHFYKIVQNNDFILKWDETEDHLTLSWIYRISDKYKGRDIFNSLIEYCKKKNIPRITAYCVRGNDSIIVNNNKKEIYDTGYYTLLKWGFKPDKGVKFLNKTLKTNYSTIESAIKSPIFWKKWKDKGVDFTGYYEIKKPTQ